MVSAAVTAMDQSREMLDIARTRAPRAGLVHSLFPPLPFRDDAFATLFTANFYGLLRPDERVVFLAEARRVAGRLLVLDLRSDDDRHTERTEQRVVGGTGYPIFRRLFTPANLVADLGGELLYTGRYFLLLSTELR
ncbi:class I SAM-dependent methyltransferase [Kitasatospora sp. NPDC002040]|uniref:class I SAM-dependent methyltransferase n=1 Tax=Kitasatospora sp. NPDC002040 TaxID=3154661 RepID=UPI003319E8D4